MLGFGAIGQFALGQFGDFPLVGGYGASSQGPGKPVRRKKKLIFPLVLEPEVLPERKRRKRAQVLPPTVADRLRALPLPIATVLPPGKSKITRELLDRWFIEEEKAKVLKVGKALNVAAQAELFQEAGEFHKKRLVEEEEMLLVSFLAAYYRSLN